MPSTDWHCAACKERITLRDSLQDSQFENIDSQRYKELEDALINELIENGSSLRSDSAVIKLPIEIFYSIIFLMLFVE